jgi:RNA polymerase sigma factor (sigma-70 family)
MFGAAKLTDAMVRSAAQGQAGDLDRVTEALAPQVHGMVRARLSPTRAQFHATEEIAQEALIALARGLPSLKNQTVAGLKAFLSSIVGHKVCDWLRRHGDGDDDRPRARSLDSHVAGRSTAGPLWQFLSVSGTSPASAVERAELADQVMAELGRMRQKDREVITLALFDQLPIGEIARQMGVSAPAASMMLLRAVRTLRRSVATRGKAG